MLQFFFFNEGEDFGDDTVAGTLGNVFKFFVSRALPQGTAADYFEMSINLRRIFIDLGYFISLLLILNILKGYKNV